MCGGDSAFFEARRYLFVNRDISNPTDSTMKICEISKFLTAHPACKASEWHYYELPTTVHELHHCRPLMLVCLLPPQLVEMYTTNADRQFQLGRQFQPTQFQLGRMAFSSNARWQ